MRKWGLFGVKLHTCFGAGQSDYFRLTRPSEVPPRLRVKPIQDAYASVIHNLFSVLQTTKPSQETTKICIEKGAVCNWNVSRGNKVDVFLE